MLQIKHTQSSGITLRVYCGVMQGNGRMYLCPENEVLPTNVSYFVLKRRIDVIWGLGRAKGRKGNSLPKLGRERAKGLKGSFPGCVHLHLTAVRCRRICSNLNSLIFSSELNLILYYSNLVNCT